MLSVCSLSLLIGNASFQDIIYLSYWLPNQCADYWTRDLTETDSDV